MPRDFEHQESLLNTHIADSFKVTPLLPSLQLGFQLFLHLCYLYLSILVLQLLDLQLPSLQLGCLLFLHLCFTCLFLSCSCSLVCKLGCQLSFTFVVPPVYSCPEAAGSPAPWSASWAASCPLLLLFHLSILVLQLLDHLLPGLQLGCQLFPHLCCTCLFFVLQLLDLLLPGLRLGCQLFLHLC